MATPQRQATDALKKVEKLSDQLDTARDASEVTTKKVRDARHTVETIKSAVRLQLSPGSPTRKLKLSKDRSTTDGKSKAAVELGRKGGTARAKALTRHQRSALAIKAAQTRWNKK
jgi:hypothetical protein